MYLLDGSPAPDHSTIARFRSKHFAPCAEKIMAELSMLLYDVKEISAQALFIDRRKGHRLGNFFPKSDSPL